jgi:hypothetical protein
MNYLKVTPTGVVGSICWNFCWTVGLRPQKQLCRLDLSSKTAGPLKTAQQAVPVASVNSSKRTHITSQKSEDQNYSAAVV